MGRTKSNIDNLPEDWERAIIELYKEGASDVEVKSLLHDWRGTFSNDLWERWMKEEYKFSETIKNGRLFSEAWWEKNGRTNLTNPKFNYVGWYMNMKNRFGWKDRNDITSGNEPIKQDLNIVVDNNKTGQTLKDLRDVKSQVN